MKRTRAGHVLRLTGRYTAAAVALLVATLVAVQFARAVGENVAAARQLHAIRSDIAVLEKQRADQMRELRRLRTPEGAIPEIHERLRLVKPNEAIIFLSPHPSAPPPGEAPASP